jgi:pimeloyl-ACP methyl ester carboxylesterase
MFTTLPDGCRLAHDDTGGREPAAVLLHGQLCDRTLLAAQHRALAGRGRRVVSVDLRGHGESDRPEDGCTLDGLADDLAHLVTALGLDRPALVGWSLGAAVATVYAARRPESVSSLVLVAGTPSMLRRPDWEFGMPEEAAAGIGAVLGSDFAAGTAAFLDGFFPEGDAAGAKDRMRDLAARCSPAVTLSLMADAMGRDLRPLLDAVTCPVHAIAGELDALCPPGVAEYVAKRTGGTHTVIPGAGHVMPLTRPDELNEALARALD